MPKQAVTSPADFGGTTHPEVVAGIIEFLQERGYSDIVVAEGSWVGDCTTGFDFCIHGCPPDEETIYRELKALIR